MNVAFDKLSTGDAAKMIGIDKTTIAAWCRNGLINFTNVSDGTGKARYMLAEDEVMHLKALFKKYGKRKAMLYYKKDWNDKKVNTAEEAMFIDKPELAHVDAKGCNIVNTAGMLQQYFPGIPSVDTATPLEVENNQPTVIKKKFDIDEITTTISYIQDIKERLEDIEAEKNQLLKEKEDLVKEILEFL